MGTSDYLLYLIINYTDQLWRKALFSSILSGKLSQKNTNLHQNLWMKDWHRKQFSRNLLWTILLENPPGKSQEKFVEKKNFSSNNFFQHQIFFIENYWRIIHYFRCFLPSVFRSFWNFSFFYFVITVYDLPKRIISIHLTRYWRQFVSENVFGILCPFSIISIETTLKVRH